MKKLIAVVFVCLFTIIIYFKDGKTSTINNGRLVVDGGLLILYSGHPEKVEAIIKMDEVKYIWKN